jgi:hypothetical protein
MKRYHLQFNPEDTSFALSLEVKPVPFLVKLVILLFGLAAILLPIAFFMLQASGSKMGFKVHFAHLLIFALQAGVAYFLLRLYLWNAFGTEHFTYANKQLHHRVNYKWFSQQKHAIDCTEFPTLNFEKGQDQEQRLVFLADNQTIHSTISLTTADIENLKTAFDKR